MAKEKKVRSKKAKWIKRGVIAAAVIAGFGFMSAQAQKKAAMPKPVETSEVEAGDIDQTVSISGTVVSDETKSFFVDLAVEVQDVNVKQGDEVKNGDVLITYNEEKMDNAVKAAKLNKQQAAGSYADTTYYSDKVFAEYGLSSFKTIDEQTDHIDDMILALETQIKTKQQRYTDTMLEFEKYTQDYDENGEAGIQEYSEEIMQKQLAMQRAMSDNQYAMQNDEEIRAWTKQIEDLNRLKGELSQSRLTDGAKSAASAAKQLSDLNANETIDSVEKLREGVKATFNGVVTELSAVEGMTTTPGMSLITLQSTDSVKVVVNVTKYDIDKVREGQSVIVKISGREYDGKVKQIARTASKNDRGGSVVRTDIEILKPDEYIILGMEADVEIKTATSKGALLVPVESINVDSEGTFVYVVENETVVRKNITTGIASDYMEEVLTGLNEGDRVLTNITSDIVEGMPATTQETEE